MASSMDKIDAPAPYIIILDENISDAAFRALPSWASAVDTTIRSDGQGNAACFANPFDYTYNFGGMKGFAGMFDTQTIESINNRPDVAYVEQDTYVSATFEEPMGINEAPLWGLNAISRHPEDFTAQYTPHESGGEGIATYVLDTGIRVTHEDFGGRAKWGKNFVPNSEDTDTHGHGTHVAGTIAGALHGVAKKSSVIAVKVLGSAEGDPKAPTSRIIAALEWVINQVTNPATPEKPHNTLINMSLGGPFNRALNQTINAAVTAGVTCIVAAGNNNGDVAQKSPASADSAFTVGSIDHDYNRFRSSNYGSRLEIFAPGFRILSCGIEDDTATVESTGTSMATPHVTGVAAYLMKLEGLKTPKQVCVRLRKLAIKNVVKNRGSDDTPNLFLFNGGNPKKG